MATPPSAKRYGPLSLMEGALSKKPLTPRRAVQLIALATLFLTLGGALALRIFDHQEFDSFGDGFWFALQTVTTVGYGDVVPERVGGRLVGVVLMLNGIGFLTVTSAAVTALLIEQARRHRSAADDKVLAKLEQIDARLDELEAAVRQRPGERSD